MDRFGEAGSDTNHSPPSVSALHPSRKGTLPRNLQVGFGHCSYLRLLCGDAVPSTSVGKYPEYGTLLLAVLAFPVYVCTQSLGAVRQFLTLTDKLVLTAILAVSTLTIASAFAAETQIAWQQAAKSASCALLWLPVRYLFSHRPDRGPYFLDRPYFASVTSSSVLAVITTAVGLAHTFVEPDLASIAPPASPFDAVVSNTSGTFSMFRLLATPVQRGSVCWKGHIRGSS